MKQSVSCLVAWRAGLATWTLTPLSSHEVPRYAACYP